MAYFDTEDIARSIGQKQMSAMANIWGNAEPYSGNQGSFSFLGPYGQGLAESYIQPYKFFDLTSDSSGQSAMQDLNELKNTVQFQADQYAFAKSKALAEKVQNARSSHYNVGQSEYGGDGATLGNPLLAKATQAARAARVAPSSGDNVTGDYTTPGNANAGGAEVESYIRQAATSRGIDPEIAMRVARSEGGTEVAKRGTFNTGSSWWPFQLHYGGRGTPFAHLGTTAGMGNQFTAQTGFQPGDPAAWRASVDFALDRAKQAGWGDWYGAKAQGITGMMGIGQTPQRPAPSGSGAPYQVNRTSQFGLGLSRDEALAFCGPAAALALSQFYGNNIPVEQVRSMAVQSGWNANRGMAGPASQQTLLSKMGINANRSGWDPAKAQQLLSGGTPVIIDTPGHYFIADQFDPSRGYRVGTSGTDLRGGGEWMTPQQMAALAVAGNPREMLWRA